MNLRMHDPLSPAEAVAEHAIRRMELAQNRGDTAAEIAAEHMLHAAYKLMMRQPQRTFEGDIP